MAKKLNSMRLLEQHDIPYEVLEYPSDIRDAEEVAEVLGVPYDTVFKTLIVEAVDNPRQTKPYIVIIASEDQLDLKKMAAAAGEKKVKMAPHDDAERLTGLQVGGISALALMQKQWPVYLDSRATEHQHIVMSAGQRGLQVRVPVVPLMSMIKPKIVDVSQEG